MSQVTIQDVKINNINKGKSNYQEAIVVYTTDRGENKEKKIISFSNPAVFAFVAKITHPTRVEIENAGAPYYNWTKITEVSKEEVRAPGVTKVSGYQDNRETPAERAARQVMIVKQSSIAQAVSSIGPGAELEEYLTRAQQFVDWVMSDPTKELDSGSND